jgi:hypothetical protein
MPNVEFIARNGIVSRGNLVVSGSVISTSPASFSGSLSVTGSIASTNNIQGNQFSSTIGSVIGGRYFSDVLIAAGTVTYGSYSTANVANFDIYANNENVNNGAQLRLSSRFGGDNGAYLVSSQTGSVVLAVNGTATYNQGLVLNGSTMNVGIGVSTPTARLQAKGSGTTSATTAFQVQNANASSSLAVLDNGNVGIGVTAPTAQIHIAGQGTGTYLVKAPGINGNPQFEIYRPADNTTAIKWYDAGATTQGIIDNASSNVMTMTGNWAIANDGSSLFSTYAGYTKPAIDLYTYVYQYDFNTPLIRARVNTSNIVTNTIFQVNQNGNGYFSGSVGIGTSTPSASLHISGSSNSALFEIDSPAVNNIIFVSGSGNVGINTTSSIYNLDIVGTGFNTFTTNTPFIVDTSANNYRIANLLKYNAYNPGAFANNTFDVFSVGANTTSSATANANPFFRVNLAGGNSTGYYGAAGTNNSLAQLNSITTSTFIVSAQGGGIALIGSTSTNPTVTTISAGQNLNLRSDNNGAYGGGGINYYSSINGSQHSQVWYHNATEQMRLKYTGELLIGTATGSAKLTVRGSGATSSTTGLLVQNSNGSSSLQVLDNGNVGIGGDAIAASYKLRVYGSVWADSFDQLSALNGGAGVGKIQYYDDGATLLMRVYGPHSSEAVKGILTLDRQDLEYTTLANSITHTASFFMDHPSFVIRSNNTSANSFFLQNYMYASGALFVTNQPAGGDTSFRFRPSASLVGSTDVFVINTSGAQVTGNLSVTSPASTSSALYAYKSGSTVLDIQGSQGQLFSVIDALSGSLMSVNDISGLPIVEVFSDDRVVMGTYGAPGLIVSGSTATVATGSSAPTGTAPEGTFRFAVAGGLYYIYAYIGGAWRSGSLA